MYSIIIPRSYYNNNVLAKVKDVIMDYVTKVVISNIFM